MHCQAPRTPRAAVPEPPARAPPRGSGRSAVLCAIPLLSQPDLDSVAQLLGVQATVAAVRDACAACPFASARVDAYLFAAERSATPPRQMLRPPHTPPPVVRASRVARYWPPARPLRF